ncbi:MAG: hypothetical protein ACI9D0_000814 [Bacteroidia bacterium]|jgi:hypothetical protein
MTDARTALELFFGHANCVSGEAALVRVLEGPVSIAAARKSGETVIEFLRLPSTGGAFVLASLSSARAFSIGMEGMTLSRPVWLLARRVLGFIAHLGVHRCLGLPRFGVVLPTGHPARGREFSLQMGVPGGGQKFIVREWGEGEPESFWKIGTAGLPADLVTAESDALQWFASSQSCGELAPTLLACGSNEAVSWLRMESIRGEGPATNMDQCAQGFLTKLAGSAYVSMELESSAWFQNLTTRLGQIAAEAPEIANTCQAALDAVLPAVSGKQLDFCPSHGDFTPWNAKVEAGEMHAFDWEFFQPCAPALFDWHHWILQTGVLVQHDSGEQLFAALQEPTALSGTADVGERAALLSLYLVDMLVREEWIMQHGRPEFKQVEWLRCARVELLTRSAA